MKINVIHRNGGCHARILLSLLVGLMSGLPAQADYSSTVMSFSPIAYWRLNETGSTTDAAIAMNSGTGGSALNGAYFNFPPHGVIGALAGSSDTAVSFDGSSQRMLVPYASALNPAAPFTAEIWLNPAQATAANQCTISDGQFGSNRSGWLIYQQADAWNLRAYTGTGTGTSLNITSPATTAAANVWHHLVVVNDGSTFTLYVDGVAAASGSASGYMTGQSGGTCIGSRADGPFFWPGTADELAIYPTALSADDVAAHYANGNDAGRTTAYETLVGNSSPAGYYRLDEPTFVFPTAANVGSLGAAANGTYSPGTVPGSAGPPNAGLEAGNLSCLFDGTGDIDCGNSTGFDVPQISIAAWIKVDVLGDYMSILAKGNLLWRFHTSASPTADKLEWLLETPTGVQSVTGNRSLADGQWHHAVAVYDGANASIYLDGTLDNSKAITGGEMIFKADNVYIGSQGFDSQGRWRWNGNIDEVAVFNYGLSSSQVSQLYSVSPASISLTAVAGASCVEAQIVLTQPDFSGDMFVSGIAPGTPTALVFEILSTSCGTGDTFAFYLNNTPLGETPADPTFGCTCHPAIQSFTVTNSAGIASAWNVSGNNSFRFVKNGYANYFGWVRVKAQAGGFSQTVSIYDTTGGNSTRLNLCDGYNYGPLDVAQTMVEPFIPPSVSAHYQDSLLPAHLNISSLPAGSYTLCVTGMRPWESVPQQSCSDFVKTAGRDKIIINGLGNCQEPPNRPPVAKCRDVTVTADGNCSAVASIDNGSFDPDGDAITTTQNPPGPYPIGATFVQLTAAETSGERLSSSCQATVLVLPPLPTLPCPADIVVGNDPGQGSAVVTYDVTAQSHCTLAAKGDVFLNADFTLGDGGFTVETPRPFNGPWMYDPASGAWHEDGQDAENSQPNTSLLISPVLSVTKAGVLSMEFAHRYSFEFSYGTAWDGGQVQASVNGGPFVAVTEFAQNGYGGGTVGVGSASDLHGQPAFTGESPGYASGPITSIAILGSVNAGDTVRVRFMAASDTNTRGNVPNWEIRHIALYQGGQRGDAVVPAICHPASGSAFSIGTTRVFCTASDAFGQTAQCSFTVTVEDREPPTIVCPADFKTTVAPGECGRVVTFEPAVTDNCSPATVNVYSGFNPSGGGAPFSNPVGSFTAQDVSFATQTGYNWHPFGLHEFGADITGRLRVASDGIYTFSLSSDDGSLLFIDGNLVVDNGGGHGPQVTSGSIGLTAGLHSFEVQFFEAYGGGSGLDLMLPEGVAYAPNVSLVCVPPSGSDFPVGTTPVTCTATDSSGNKATCSFKVTVRDDEAPKITCPANIAVGCSLNALVPVTFTVTATDNCDPAPKVVCTPPSGSGFPVGETTVHCTATDRSGNTASCSFKVIRAPLAFTGFLPPIGGADATGGSFAKPLQTFPMGSAVPVKFTAACHGSPVLSGIHRLQVVKYLSQTDSQRAIDAVAQDAAAPGNQFRLAGGQWYFNLDTKATRMSVGKWLLLVTLSDGSQHSVWIQLK